MRFIDKNTKTFKLRKEIYEVLWGVGDGVQLSDLVEVMDDYEFPDITSASDAISRELYKLKQEKEAVRTLGGLWYALGSAKKYLS